jgi:hypothetical protein
VHYTSQLWGAVRAALEQSAHNACIKQAGLDVVITGHDILQWVRATLVIACGLPLPHIGSLALRSALTVKVDTCRWRMWRRC